ncbi:transcriptional regulator, partial [Glaesserella parasuis]|nr:transcriptional regulator [Glaesserella parasuis]
MEEIKQARASKSKKTLDIYQRATVRDENARKLFLNELSVGQALQYLLLHLLAMMQERYSEIFKVSHKTLS